MKRLALVAVLLLGSALAAHADNDTYTNVLKAPRSDMELHADVDACAARYGAPQNGVPTSRSSSAAWPATAGASITRRSSTPIRIRTIRD